MRYTYTQLITLVVGFNHQHFDGLDDPRRALAASKIVGHIFDAYECDIISWAILN